MVIRCERCSTLYELDEALLSPSGSPVQCTRCEHVFTAFSGGVNGAKVAGAAASAPTPAAAAAATGAAPAAEPAQPERRAERRTPPPAATRASAPAAPAAAPAAARTEAPRVGRSGPAPVYRPAPPAQGAGPSVARAPMLRRDPIGSFEARLRWAARLRWLVPAAVAVVVAAVVAGWLLLSRRGDATAGRELADARALLARDDAASLDDALGRLGEAVRRSPRARGVVADRALAQVLRAAGLVEEGEALAARLVARTAERDRLRRDQPAGWEEGERAAAAETRSLEPEVRARTERARTLTASALETLRGLEGDVGDTVEVSRALATYHVAAGDRERARKAVHAARARAPGDPFANLAEAWGDALDPDRAARERAVVELGALSAAHPELLRSRYLLARTQGALGRRVEALATVDALLASNARHEGARRLRDELHAAASLPAPAPAPTAAVVEPAQPDGKPALQPRNRSPQVPAGPPRAAPPAAAATVTAEHEPAAEMVPAAAPEPVPEPIPATATGAPGAQAGGGSGDPAAPPAPPPEPPPVRRSPPAQLEDPGPSYDGG